MGYNVSPEFNSGNSMRETNEDIRSFKRISMHSMSMTDDDKGSRATGISIVPDIGLNISR